MSSPENFILAITVLSHQSGPRREREREKGSHVLTIQQPFLVVPLYSTHQQDPDPIRCSAWDFSARDALRDYTLSSTCAILALPSLPFVMRTLKLRIDWRKRTAPGAA